MSQDDRPVHVKLPSALPDVMKDAGVKVVITAFAVGAVVSLHEGGDAHPVHEDHTPISAPAIPFSMAGSSSGGSTSVDNMSWRGNSFDVANQIAVRMRRDQAAAHAARASWMSTGSWLAGR